MITMHPSVICFSSMGGQRLKLSSVKRYKKKRKSRLADKNGKTGFTLSRDATVTTDGIVRLLLQLSAVALLLQMQLPVVLLLLPMELLLLLMALLLLPMELLLLPMALLLLPMELLLLLMALLPLPMALFCYY